MYLVFVQGGPISQSAVVSWPTNEVAQQGISNDRSPILIPIPVCFPLPIPFNAGGSGAPVTVNPVVNTNANPVQIPQQAEALDAQQSNVSPAVRFTSNPGMHLVYILCQCRSVPTPISASK